MIKLSHAKLITIAGLVWLGIGLFLFTLGIKLTMAFVQNPANFLDASPLLTSLTALHGSIEAAAITIMAICLFIGYAKGKFALAKSANRVIARIQTFPNPTSLSNIFSGKYYLLIGIMIGLGMMIRFLQLPNDIRGAIDIAIGAALINGSLFYFRKASHL